MYILWFCSLTSNKSTLLIFISFPLLFLGFNFSFELEFPLYSLDLDLFLSSAFVLLPKMLNTRTPAVNIYYIYGLNFLIFPL